MSYSFQFTASTKHEARERFAAEFERVVSSQPVHAADRKAAIANADAMIDLLDLLADDAGQDIQVYANGSIGWTGGEADPTFTSASTSCTAALVPRKG